MLDTELDAAYVAMAADEEREAEALEWSEAMIGDVADAARRYAPTWDESLALFLPHRHHQHGHVIVLLGGALLRGEIGEDRRVQTACRYVGVR